MRRRLGFFLIVGAAVSLIAVSTAWACGVLATLTLDKTSTNPGSSNVAFTGKNYGVSSPTTTYNDVTIRLDSRTGPVLATVTPGATGAGGANRIIGTLNMPASTQPGWHVILATQSTTTGLQKSGTPGRASLRVQGAASAARHRGGATVTPWGPSKPTGGSGAALAVSGGNASSPAFVPTLLGILLSLGLLGTGVALVVRSRGTGRPELGA